MSFFGPREQVQTTTQTSSQNNQQRLDPYAQQHVNQTRGYAQQGYNAAMAPGQMFGGPTSAFNQGLAGYGQEVNFGMGLPPHIQAQMVQAGGGIQADGPGGFLSGMSFGGGGAPSQFDVNRIQDFMDPYERDVIGGIQTDADRQRQQAMNAAQQQATQAGAFGGSRGEVFKAQALRDVNQDEASRIAQQRSAGYSQALGAGMGEWQTMQDIGARSGQAGASQAIQMADMRMRAQMANAGMGMDAQRFNQGAGLQAGGLNLQGYGLDLSGRAQQAAMNQNRFGALMLGGEQQRGIFNQQAQEGVWRHQQGMDMMNMGMGPYGMDSSQRGSLNQRQVTPMQNNPLAGAIGGAQVGSTFGGWGAIAGGLLGAGASYL